MSKIIGIDLGSTLSEVAIMEGGKPIIIVNDEGSRTTPSVISFAKEGERKIGSAAKRQAITNPKTTINLIKRFMGGTYDEVKDNVTHVQYEVIDRGGYPRVKISDREYTPEELSAMILSKMKQIAEDYLQEEVTEAVITVPAYFNDAQREATKRAGEIAGLNVRRIIAEPTAAILASNIDTEKGGKYMVVDYGGSTLDFSIADISDNVVEILASNGDVYCGGSDLDKILSNYIVSEFKNTDGIDLSSDFLAMSRIMEAAEKAKMELSSVSSTDINLPYITAIDGVPKHLIMSINKAKFEQLIEGEINKVVRLGHEAVKKSNINVSDLDGILLVGGSTRIPKLQEELTKAFNRPLIKNVNVDEVVALGAAVQGSILTGENKDILLLDVTPLSLGIDTLGGVMATIIEENTTIPCSKTKVFTTATENQSAVTIVIGQGNRYLTKDNKQIGVFNLEGILPAPAGIPQIEVTFDIDTNGILSVSAKDKGTGNEQKITIQSRGSLSESDIERMKQEAKDYAEEDKQHKVNDKKLYDNELFATTVEKTMFKAEPYLKEGEKEKLLEKAKELKQAIKDRDFEKLDKVRSEMDEMWTPAIRQVFGKNDNKDETTSTDNPFNFDPSSNPFNFGK